MKPNDTSLLTRFARGRGAPFAVIAFTLVCFGQLRHLQVGPDGGLVWDAALALVVTTLALMNVAVWVVYREAKRLERQLAS